MYSTGSIMDWVYFKASLRFLESIGFEDVRTRIFELGGYLAERLGEAGLDVLAKNFKNHPTGIIVAQQHGVDSGFLVKKLMSQGIVAQERLGRIRFSPHIYNGFDQLDKTADVIKELIG